MKYQLKDFQSKAVYKLTKQLKQAGDMYERYGNRVSCSLSAVTGSGKTVMAAAAIEALFNGSNEFDIAPNTNATVLWVTDSPSLNDQTWNKFENATDLDFFSIKTIENTFTQEQYILKPGYVYFLNRQKLSDSSILTKGGEVETFWKVLQNTYDEGITVYMMLDEAHRGLGERNSKKREEERQTIYAKLIDGFNNNDGYLAPMPIVVGISATIERFRKAMEHRTDRTTLPEVRVSPQDVQASGLLKDTIVISVPSENDAVKEIYLTNACRALQDSKNQWKMWCKANDVPIINPLLVIQVNDKVKNSELQELCSEISQNLKWINPNVSFANVFGEHMNIHLNGFDIYYVSPEKVQSESRIQVLFAKEAISTGWDCPRAEVIYSLRPHTDYTYIAQLIGRMVRTPLAQRVEFGTLNSVSCFLPYFDKSNVKAVVKHLTEDNEDDDAVSEESGRKVITNPVEVKWDSSLGVDSAFSTIKTRKRSARQRNYIRGALELSGLLMKYEIDLDAEDYVINQLMRELNDSILTYKTEYLQAKESLSKIKSTNIKFRTFDENSITSNEQTEDADSYAITHARRKADRIFELAITNKFFEQEKSKGISSMKINTDIAAAASVDSIVNNVTKKAEEIVKKLQIKYEGKISTLNEPAQNEFTSSMFQNGITREVSLIKPTNDIYDGDSKEYPKHVLNDPKNHRAPISLSPLEDKVVMSELKRGALAWYRNPANGSNHALSIMYSSSEGLQALHPDFIFFEKVNNVIKPYIVDPHGYQLSDSLDKLQGYVNYVKLFGNIYSRIWALDSIDGEERYLDLKDTDTQKAIMKYNESTVRDLYTGKYSHKY